MYPRQRPFMKEFWRLKNLPFSCIQSGRPILESFVNMENLPREYLTNQQSASEPFELVRDIDFFHNKLVFKATQTIKQVPCPCSAHWDFWIQNVH